MGGILDWDFDKSWGGGNWFNRFGVQDSDTPLLDVMNHYLQMGTSYEDSGQLIKPFLDTERWYKEGLQTWEDTYGGANWQYQMGLRKRDEADDEVAETDPDTTQQVISGVNLNTDTKPPTATDTRAVEWNKNIRRALGDVGEDLYRTRGRKASILTRRGMMA